MWAKLAPTQGSKRGELAIFSHFMRIRDAEFKQYFEHGSLPHDRQTLGVELLMKVGGVMLADDEAAAACGVWSDESKPWHRFMPSAEVSSARGSWQLAKDIKVESTLSDASASRSKTAYSLRTFRITATRAPSHFYWVSEG